MAEPEFERKPEYDPEQILKDAAAVQADNLQVVRWPGGGWMVPGLGFTAHMLDPFTDDEIVDKIAEATNVAFIPDLKGKTIVVVRGLEEIEEEFGKI